MSDRPCHPAASPAPVSARSAPDDALRRLAALMGAALARELTDQSHQTEHPNSDSAGNKTYPLEGRS